MRSVRVIRVLSCSAEAFAGLNSTRPKTHWGSSGGLHLLQIPSGGVWQTRDLHLSRNMLYLLTPRLCFFIVLKRDVFVYRDCH